jgi:hypothetical protein
VKTHKLLKAVIIVIIAIITIILLIQVKNKLQSIYLKNYNTKYIQNYFENNVVNYKIIGVDEYIMVYGILDGGHKEYINSNHEFLESGTKQYVNTDYTDKSYVIEYTIQDKDIDYTYEIIFSHGPNEKISINEYHNKEYQVDLYNKYNDNFQLMKTIVEDNGGEAELVSKYAGEDSIDDYCMIMYVPDFSTACSIEEALYNEVYGGYAYEHLDITQDINIDLPRYIVTNDGQEYATWLINLESASNLFKSKRTESADSYLSSKAVAGESYNETEYVYTTDIINSLHGKQINYTNKYNLSFTTLSESMNIEIPNKWIITNEHYSYNELGYAEYIYNIE